MSFSDLINDDNPSTKWSHQRKRLFQIVIGSLVIFLALGTAAFFLFYDSALEEEKVESIDLQEEQNVQALTQLLEFQREAKRLQEEIEQMNLEAALERREVASDVRPDKVGTKKRKTAQRVARVTQAQIIDFEPGEGFSELGASAKNEYIPTGAVFQARLLTPIKTSVARTFVMAETTSEFRMDMNRRIPKNSRLIGRARLNSVLKGVIVEFETLVLPNGIETRLEGLALSRNALPEIDGLFFSNELETYGTALAFGFLSGFSDAARERESTVFGSQPTESVSNQVLAGLSTASFQVAEEMLRDIRSSAVEYVVVPAGEPIFVALTRRYELNQGEE